MVLQDGRKLVILNDFVLDISAYQFKHPGGKFLLSNNVGKDISKFFFGGQSMDNYKGSKPCNHSSISKSIVN